MCGIVGWLDWLGEGQETALARVGAMAEVLRHRGPDDAGTEVYGEGGAQVALGHRRLSILDLSALGRQPMVSADGTLAVTFNGEIYNYKALRRTLEAQGIAFQTGTDTESLLYAYAHYGNEFLAHLDGMFAFALHDRARHRLILARDRLGKKPLYYCHQPGRFFAFASEPAALLGRPEVPVAPDWHALAAYLEFGFVPAPATPYEDVRVLPPGHWMVLDTRDGLWVQTPAPFWDIRFSAAPLPSGNVLAAFETLMRASIKKRLQSDVPVGILLSGGLDSTTVTAVARKLLPGEPLHTFSVGFDIPALDEREKARAAAKALKTVHHEFHCSDRDFLDVLPVALEASDSLFAEHLVPMALVSRLAKEHVTVVLSGDGADEVLGGYNSYANVGLYERWAERPMAQTVLRSGLGLVLPMLRGMPDLGRKLSRAERMLSVPPEQAYLAYRYANTLGREAENALLPDSPLLEALQQESPFARLLAELTLPENLAPMERHLYLDMKTSLAEAILMKADRMSMAYGLEVRCPFLDAGIMTWLFSLPGEWKRRNGRSKWLLRQYLSDKVPPVLWKQKKAGFSAPFSHWLRERPAFYDAIAGQLLGDIDALPALGLRRAYVERLLAEHRAGAVDHGGRLWQLVVLAAWGRRYSRLAAGGVPCPSVMA